MDELTIKSLPGSQEGVRILRLRGPFTLQGVFEFQSTFRSGDYPVTLIDLTEVPYLDSASLGSLVGVHTSSQRLKRKYALVGVAPRLRTLFQVAGVDGLFVIYPSLEEAQKNLIVTGASNQA